MLKYNKWKMFCVIAFILSVFGLDILLQSAEKEVANSIIIAFGIVVTIVIGLLYILSKHKESDESKKINAAIRKQNKNAIERGEYKKENIVSIYYNGGKNNERR